MLWFFTTALFGLLSLLDSTNENTRLCSFHSTAKELPHLLIMQPLCLQLLVDLPPNPHLCLQNYLPKQQLNVCPTPAYRPFCLYCDELLILSHHVEKQRNFVTIITFSFIPSHATPVAAETNPMNLAHRRWALELQHSMRWCLLIKFDIWNLILAWKINYPPREQGKKMIFYKIIDTERENNNFWSSALAMFWKKIIIIHSHGHHKLY